MIGHIIEMEMDYINTSHPNIIGGNKAHEMALQQVKSSRIAAPNLRQKDGVDLEIAPTSERSLKSRAILARSAGGFVPDQVVRLAQRSRKLQPQDQMLVQVGEYHQYLVARTIVHL